MKFSPSCAAAMKKAGHDALVALSQDNVTYTAGFLVPSHASNRFRRTITILAGDTFAAQIVVNVEENLARQRSRFSRYPRLQPVHAGSGRRARRRARGGRRRRRPHRDRARLHAGAGLHPAQGAAAEGDVRALQGSLFHRRA